MSRLPPLDWLRSFEAAARCNGFAAAAREINLSPGAVSYQVRSLEQELGFKLFERLPRGLRLTDMGRAYLPSLRKAFDDIAVSTTGLFGSARQETLTIRSSVSYATLILPEALTAFRALYPEIRIRLFATVWSDRPEDEGADLEIRYGDGNWPGWAAERLDFDESIIVGRMENVDTLPLGALARRGVIQIMGCENHWFRLLKQERVSDPEQTLETAFIADNSVVALECAAMGLGPTLVSRDFAQPFLKNGRLERLASCSLATTSGHFVLLPQSTGRIRGEAVLFRDWLLQRAMGVG